MAFAAGRRMALVPGTARSSPRSPRERSRPRAKSSPRTRWPTAFGCVGQNPACSMASFTRRRPIVRTPDVGAVVYGRAATALCAPSHPGGDGPGGPAAADAIARLDRGGRRARFPGGAVPGGCRGRHHRPRGSRPGAALQSSASGRPLGGRPGAGQGGGRRADGPRPQSDVMVETIQATVDERNAMALLSRYDVIVDGTDSFRARYLLSDAAYLLKKPLVHGSIFRIEGQVTVFQPGRGCYRCLYPEPPPAGAIGESEQVGVLAALPGIIGTIQAAETIKLITQVGDGLVNRVLLHDAMAMTFQEVRYRRNRGCPLCGDRPTIRSLVDYGAFTGAEALR